ncbi:MFS transporter [Akkermansiaceae bacterium]|nr:MFS transporter [Akkermansiaceae bacterium]MDB4544372.1 MFS transporter [Akkermansiaceae bacterium]
MQTSSGIIGHRYWIAVAFFLMAGAVGMWFPALSNILPRYGLGGWAVWIFMIPGICGIISPLILGAQVDQKFQAQKVLGWIMWIGAIFVYLAFHALENKWGPWWFVSFFTISALISAPVWSLLTTIALSGLADPGKSFGFYRVWATIGWMMAGFLVGFLSLDFSAKTGQIAAGIRMIAGGVCFLMPVTIPKGIATGKLSDALGLGALKLLKDRDQLIYFVTAFLFSIPLAAYYLHTPVYLAELDVAHPSYYMSSAQIVEAVAMVGMGVVIGRFRVKVILLVAIACGVVRYFFYSLGDFSIEWLAAGIMLHGICWTFFYEAGRVFIHRRVDEGMRGQAQALIGLVSNGLGGVLGLLIVKELYLVLLPMGGWTLYWQVLSGMSALSLVVFWVGYQGLAKSES